MAAVNSKKHVLGRVLTIGRCFPPCHDGAGECGGGILAFDLSTEPEPEAYMGYARYNADSTSMRKGFRVFSNSKLEG